MSPIKKEKEDTGEEALRAAVIGPAGENLSLLACVMNDRHRAAGRGGAGAVMGSKNLKAVAVRGTRDVQVADKEKLKEVNKSVLDAMKAEPNAEQVTVFRNYGTGAGTGMYTLNGDAPIKNWGGVGPRDMGEASAAKITSMAMDKYKKKGYACASCPLACGADFDVDEGDWPLKDTHRPEYETLAAFGGMCLNDNAESIIMCNEICNRSGIDTISTGATVAWAIECFENNLITTEDTDGLELTWGNAVSIVGVTKAIAENKGFGKILALGSKGAAKKLGKGEQYLVTVKGIELPMHDPKIGPGYARTYRLDPTPGRHVKGGLGGMQARDPNPAKYDVSDTGAMDLMMTGIYELLQVSGACLFSLLSVLDMVPRAIEAVCGVTCDAGFQSAAMMRIMTLRHAFNLREGLTPQDFVLPGRSVGEPPQEEGPHKGLTIDHKTLAKNFFAAMQWDETTGKPSREVLESLGGLEDVINDLYG